MSIDYLNLGSAPCEEDCAQVGSSNYTILANLEMDLYIDQLNRQFSDLIENDLIFFHKKWFNHDFGRYGEVVVSYNPDKEESFHAALYVENNIPYNWDEEAVKERKRIELDYGNIWS